MNLSLPCSIKDCPRFAETELKDDLGINQHSSNGFVLCQTCLSLVCIRVQERMAVDGVFGPVRGRDTALNFATLFNSWMRKRRGVMFLFAPDVINMGTSPQGN